MTSTGTHDSIGPRQPQMTFIVRILFLYSFFAAISTLVNLETQHAVCLLFPLHATTQTLIYKPVYEPVLIISMLAGTLTGLLVKYWLDRRFIFAFVPQNLRHDGSTFILYSLMGVVTTVIFWVSELGFRLLFSNPDMRYVGAVLGLCLGYFIKYQLDRQYVFRKESL